MLIRNLHITHLSERNSFSAFIDFVDWDWNGRPRCTFGDARNGANRIANCNPQMVCLLSFYSSCLDNEHAPVVNTVPKELPVIEIDTDIITYTANNGGGVVVHYEKPLGDRVDDVLARSRNALLRLWRCPDKTDNVIEERNQITRATHKLMTHAGYTESQAYNTIRSLAMKHQRPLARVADRIVDHAATG
jgi:ANTAR domain